MNMLQDYCVVKDDMLDPLVCDTLIDVFRQNTHLHERYDNNKKPNFTQLNFTKNKTLAPDIHDYLVYAGKGILGLYKKQVPESSYWPNKVVFEDFRIKHYASNGRDEFDMHVDAISESTAKRYLVFFWYLNDVEEGGTTEFPQLNVIVQPKKARCLMFPPMWLFPHRGAPVTKGEKFLLSSYLHYAE